MAKKSKPWSAAKFRRCLAKVKGARDPAAVCAAMMWRKPIIKRKK